MYTADNNEFDYQNKRAEYHAIGVEEYVIVDRFKQVVLVLTWQQGDYAECVLRSGEVYTTLMLPGLEIDVSEVFEVG